MINPKTQIHFLIPFYPRFTTGGNMYLAKIYEILKQKGENVMVLGADSNFVVAEKSKIKKIAYGFKQAFKIQSESVIVLTNTAFLHFLLPLLTLRIFKKHKYIIIIHHLLRYESPKKAVHFLESIFIRLIRSKITISRTSAESIKHHGLIKNDILIVTPGLDYIPKYGFQKTKISVKPTLLFVGNVEKRKSIATVIKALAEIKEFDFMFNIAGNIVEEDYYQEIKELIYSNNLEGKVKYIGKISTEKLLMHYQNSDIMIFPSLWEGYGMVIAEAMANGLPVISSDIPTSKELIDDGVDGLLFKKGDHQDLARCIKKLYNDKELYSEISINSIKRALSLNTWETASIKILEFIKNSY